MRKVYYKGYIVYEDGRVLGLKNKFLKPGLSSNGYLTVCICTKEKKESVLIHRLVAECFIPKSKNKTWVNHIDSNRLNNKASNLEWCTPKENAKHMVNNSRINNTINSVRKRMSKTVINTLTGETYHSCKEAAEKNGINENTLRVKLCGFRINDTNLIYLR